jgi:hypothetical protein
MAAAALTKMDAQRLDPAGSCLMDFNGSGMRISFFIFYDFNRDILTRQGEGHENCAAIWQSPQTIAAVNHFIKCESKRFSHDMLSLEIQLQ